MSFSIREDVPLLWILPMAQKFFSLSDIKKEFGITKSQAVVMIALYYKGSMNMSQVSEYLSSSKEQATRAVSGIVRDGFAERFESPDNRTHVNIRLTKAGYDKIEAVKTETYSRFNDRLETMVTEEDKEELKKAAMTIIAILNKINQ